MAMELTTAPTAVAGNGSDADTPPPRSKTGFSGYTNGSVKRHYPTAPATTTTLPELAVVVYKECMRNHAASIGGHALDGCCEFMPPSPESFNLSDPTALKCAACGCHRNFHRRDPDDPAPLDHHRPPIFSPVPTHVMIPGFQRPTTPATAPATNGSGRKRFRTKFSDDQKEKMKGFSDRFGWKIQKIDKGIVQDFCNEVGVGREVLKVWLHNHKNNNHHHHHLGGSSVNGGNGGGVHIENVHHHDPNSSGDGSSSSSG